VLLSRRSQYQLLPTGVTGSIETLLRRFSNEKCDPKVALSPPPVSLTQHLEPIGSRGSLPCRIRIIREGHSQQRRVSRDL